MANKNQTFSIYTPDKEIKIYCGKRLEEYQKKLTWLVRKLDTKGYSDTAKECIFSIVERISPYHAEILENDVSKQIEFLKNKRVFGDENRSTSSIVRKCIDKICKGLYYKANKINEEGSKSFIIERLLKKLNVEPTHDKILIIKNWIRENREKIIFRKYIDASNIDTSIEIIFTLFLEQLAYNLSF